MVSSCYAQLVIMVTHFFRNNNMVYHRISANITLDISLPVVLKRQIILHKEMQYLEDMDPNPIAAKCSAQTMTIYTLFCREE